MTAPKQTLDYAAPTRMPRQARHTRIYMYLLTAFTFVAMVGLAGAFDPDERPPLPATFKWIYAIIVAVLTITVILRVLAPRAGRVSTIVANIAMLPLFPFGTALGLYGLLMADKKPRPIKST